MITTQFHYLDFDDELWRSQEHIKELHNRWQSGDSERTTVDRAEIELAKVTALMQIAYSLSEITGLLRDPDRRSRWP